MKAILVILCILFLMTFRIGWYVIPGIVKMAHERKLYDIPNARKVHTLPIPRLGGVCFLPIVIVCLAAVLVVLLRMELNMDTMWKGTTIQHFLAYISGAMMLYTIGLYDDVIGVGYKIKFVVQIVASVLLCVSGLWVATMGHVFMIDDMPWWIGMPFTVVAVVYLTNAINLIDGVDGLASGLSCIALAVIAGLNVISGDLLWAMLAVAFLGVVASFFYFNVFSKTNKIFMGDGGSLTLGFTLAFLVLHFWQRNPVWNPYLHNIGIVAVSTLVIPMFDVVRVMMSRLRDHRNPFLPDKNHIHHKLMRAGLSGRMTMVVILLLSCMFIFSNYLVASYISQTIIIVMDMIMYCLMHFIINIYIWRKEAKEGLKWSRIMQVLLPIFSVIIP